jgi:hypothetical protein
MERTWSGEILLIITHGMHTQSVTELLGVVAIIAGLDNHGLSAGEATVQNNDYLAVLETAKLHKQFNTVKLMACKSITIINYSHSHFVLLYRFDVCLGEQPLGCVAELVQQGWRTVRIYNTFYRIFTSIQCDKIDGGQNHKMEGAGIS